jgi:predicted Zn-dependent peptidase
VRSFYEPTLAPARTFVAGRFDANAVSAAIREAFGDWQKAPTRWSTFRIRQRSKRHT